ARLGRGSLRLPGRGIAGRRVPPRPRAGDARARRLRRAGRQDGAARVAAGGPGARRRARSTPRRTGPRHQRNAAPARAHRRGRRSTPRGRGRSRPPSARGGFARRRQGISSHPAPPPRPGRLLRGPAAGARLSGRIALESARAFRYTTDVPTIAPSILSADFGRLADEARAVAAAGADWLHVDVMDGQFVPPITIGPAVVHALRRATTLPLDVHLMIQHPERHVSEFVRAGAAGITIHVEAETDVAATLAAIRAAGARPGLALNPPTPLDHVRPYLKT